MALLGGEFDATDIPTDVGFQPIPAGAYRCVITKSEFKETKAKDGRYLEFAFQVTEGQPFANRLVWAKLNLENKSPKAVEISRKELSAICHACGKLRVKDSAELHDIPLIVFVKIANDDNGNPQNEIAGFKSVKEFTESKPVTAGASGGSASGNKPAWM